MHDVMKVVVGAVLLFGAFGLAAANNTVPLPQQTLYCFSGELIPPPGEEPYSVGDTVLVLHTGKPALDPRGGPVVGFFPSVVVCTTFPQPILQLKSGPDEGE